MAGAAYRRKMAVFGLGAAMMCAYCGTARAVNADHLVPKSVLRRWNAGRRTEGRPALPRDFRHVTVPACFNCNIAKGARLLIPESWADRLDELNDLGIGTFRVWRGDAATLRRTGR